jgi:hypothetical protein
MMINLFLLTVLNLMIMLQNQIKNGTWLGKEILEIGTVASFINIPRDAFLQYAPIQNIQTHSNLSVLINDNLTTGLITDCALSFLQSTYSINKCYNSKKYANLNVVADEILRQAPAKRENDIIFDRCSAVPIEDYRIWFDEIPGIIPGHNPVDFRQSLEQKSQTLAQSLVNSVREIIAALKSAKKNIPARIKWQLWEAEKVLNNVLNRSKENTKSAIIPITVGGVVEVIVNIASMVLSGFLLKGAIPAIIESFKWVVTSIVAKFLGGTLIADACRHLAGQVLRGIASLLPTVINPSGLFAGAWAFLVSYAPYIIIAAIITILIIKQHQRLVADELYVIGLNEGKLLAWGHSVLFESNYEEMKQILIDMGDKIRQESSRIILDTLMGFGLQSQKGEVDKTVIAINFLLENEVTEGEGAIALAAPFAYQIANGIEWWA